MKLTQKEQSICEEYRKYGKNGLVNCRNCPLVIDARFCVCYANIDEKEFDELNLERLED